MNDYINAVNPTIFSWYVVGASGMTHINMEGKHGSVEVIVDLNGKGVIGNAEYQDNVKSLPAKVRNMKAKVSQIHWSNSAFKIPTPRGVKLGTSENNVLKAYKNLGTDSNILYTGKSINPKAKNNWVDGDNFIGGHIIHNEIDNVTIIEYVNCSPFSTPAENEWREYYILQYLMDKNGNVEAIIYAYSSDPE